MRFPEPIRARNGQTTRLRVHSRREAREVGELWPSSQGRYVSQSIQDSQGCASVVYDLVGKEAGEIAVVFSFGCRGDLARGRDPFEEENKSVERLKRCETVGIEGI